MIYQYVKDIGNDKILKEIESANIPMPLRIDTVGTNVSIVYEQALSTEDKSLLDQVVSDHERYSQTDILLGMIEDRRMWAQNMMERLKLKNTENNLTLAQSLWVHTRLRKLEFTPLQAHADAFPFLQPVVGVQLTIDLMNLVVSGDLETAYATLLCTAPDPMSENYHALDQDMINWIMGEIAAYLGWA